MIGNKLELIVRLVYLYLRYGRIMGLLVIRDICKINIIV